MEHSHAGLARDQDADPHAMPRPHAALLALKGWLNYYLHLFVADGVTYGDPALLDDLTHEDGTPGPPASGRAGLTSAERRSTLAYTSGGRAREADIAVTSNVVTERYVAAVLAEAGPLAGEVRMCLRACRAAIFEGDRPVEHYRRLTTGEALALWVSPAPASAAPR